VMKPHRAARVPRRYTTPPKGLWGCHVQALRARRASQELELATPRRDPPDPFECFFASASGAVLVDLVGERCDVPRKPHSLAASADV
jgi:hypothetical protein